MEVDMKSPEPENSKSFLVDSHLHHENPEWLIENSKGCCLDENSPLQTPEKELGLCKSTQRDASFSSGGGSSDFSLKEGTESSSLSSDSDSESFSSSVNIYSSALSTDNGLEHHKVIELGSELPIMKLQVADEENVDGKLKMRENSYAELTEKLVKCEEELRESNLKLLLAEEEIERLNTELKKSESGAVLSEHLLVQLESLQRETKMREDDLELEKGKVIELQKQVFELEAYAVNLQEQLDTERRQAVNLQEQIVRYSNDLSHRGHEVEELKVALCDAQDNFSLQKESFQSEIFGLLQKEALLEARLKEWELHARLLEDKVRQCEAEKLEIKGLHDTQELGLQGQISQLKAELAEKGMHTETLNKNLDILKLKYDMLMAEKDGVIAKVNTLVAELSSRDLQIGQMDQHLQQLHTEHVQLISGSKHAKNLEDELKLRIKDLEKEVDRQRNVISDVAEEKREVIRQLSFTLEHYRSGYKEFQAFFKHKRHAVMAS
ncbi:hypothetical protein CCACVL1_21001 [Corchorus capsularis]|uniref:Uncharacterized protein n=1 Tax=Corchorus capsularis TaxID=210143 RepID=A0A1R3H8Q8_COCAP|nr:hypothetical protein CCACVL1_21001 [Corchorus capsularis]